MVGLTRTLPQGLVSRAWGWLARRRRPRVAIHALKHVFVRGTGIDMSEALFDVASYPTLEALFVRKLKSGARQVDPDPVAFVSPVDGTVGQSGMVIDGTLLQVKGRTYKLAELLGDATDAQRFEGGAYATLYLAPRDYHRIHAPLSGQVSEGVVIPGALMPVFIDAVKSVDDLFARNERIITYIDTPKHGRVAVVKVGATLVGRITLAYDPDVWTNRPGQRQRRMRYNPPRLLQKGAEVGTFELGSTVIVIAEPRRVKLDVGAIEPGAKVRMGARIGTLQEAMRQNMRDRKPGHARAPTAAAGEPTSGASATPDGAAPNASEAPSSNEATNTDHEPS